jgi:hypothetical protein
MYVRKIAAAAGFACGAAVAFAPLASADTPITTTVDSEIATLNSIFASQAAFAGVPAADLHTSTTPGVFDTVLPADAPNTTDPGQLTILDYELFGVNPVKAGTTLDPGSYNDFNGALGKFDDAYNVYLYAAQNGGAIDPHDADFIGSQSSIDYAQSLGSATAAEQYFLNFGIGDLEGYYGIFPAPVAAAADPAAVVDLPAGTVASEISSENSLFQLEASLAGVPSSDYSLVGGFDQLTAAKDLIDAPQTGTPSPLDYLVYGFNPIHAGVADPTGSFNVFNGAETKFDDAYNVLLYASENHGALLPVADVFGNHLDFVTGAGATAASAFENFYNFAIGDLSGFFNVDLSALDITPAMSTELITLLGSL